MADDNSTYNLRQILGGEYTLTIPDMQRDYCWGLDRGPSGKVTLMMQGILHLYASRHPAVLGLLYGYESPAGSRHIAVVDGQQRITTMYLLVGMLYRRNPSAALRRLLVDDACRDAELRPRLYYSLRGDAMYFMADLVTHFFLDRNGRLSQLEQSPWYFRIYDSDPTIQSFIGAVRSIDAALEEASRSDGWDFGAFTDFVVEDLRFIYHDLGSRTDAERMYITVNTTGEPMTAAQHLKTMLATASGAPADAMERWEEMERWAWRHRDRAAGCRGSSDALLQRLAEVYVASLGEGREVALLPGRFGDLYAFYRRYRHLAGIMPDMLGLDPAVPAERFVLLPALAFTGRWASALHEREFAARLHDFVALLRNVLRYTSVAASGSDAEAAVLIVGRMRSADICELADGLKGCSAKILNADVKAACRMIADNLDVRADVAALVDRAQRHPLLNGRISRVAEWCADAGGRVDVGRFMGYVDAIYEVFGAQIDRREGLDPVRRALLSLRHPGYPIVRRGDVCLSLCWADYDWQRLLDNAPGVVRQLLDRLLSSRMSVVDTLHAMCHRFSDAGNPYFFIIKDKVLLQRCHRRTLLHPCEAFMGFYIEDSDRRATRMQWFVEQQPVQYDRDRWSTMRAYGMRCLYIDRNDCDLAIDLYFTPEKSHRYRIELFNRDESTPSPLPSTYGFDSIPALFQSFGYPCGYDRKRRRHYLLLPDATSALTLLTLLAR